MQPRRYEAESKNEGKKAPADLWGPSANRTQVIFSERGDKREGTLNITRKTFIRKGGVPFEGWGGAERVNENMEGDKIDSLISISAVFSLCRWSEKRITALSQWARGGGGKEGDWVSILSVRYYFDVRNAYGRLLTIDFYLSPRSFDWFHWGGKEVRGYSSEKVILPSMKDYSCRALRKSSSRVVIVRQKLNGETLYLALRRKGGRQIHIRKKTLLENLLS